MRMLPWLSILTAMPTAGAMALPFLAGRSPVAIRRICLGVSLLTLVLTLALWHSFRPDAAGMQFEELHAWIPNIGAEYRLGLDGLGLLMVLLTSIVVPVAIAASSQITERVAGYFSLVLLLEACLLGTFTALNFLHWFLFWELGLIPVYFLVRLWGGQRRSQAAMQFLVYSMVGSVTLLLAFLAVYGATGSFDLTALGKLGEHGLLVPLMAGKLPWHFTASHLGLLLFSGAFLGFAVKVPIIPFHTWLPATYSEAPTGTTILLTGAMSKMGLYGILRILIPLFGREMRSVLTPLLWLAVATVLLSAYSALAQKDLKRILAYSSINHLGYCILGSFALVKYTGADLSLQSQKYAAADGVLLQMFNHGLTAAALFWFVAMLEKRSGGLRRIDDFGGLRKVAPVFAGLMGIALFSSLGMPGLNGFVGEFLIFKGSLPLTPLAAAMSGVGLMITAILVLRIMQQVFSGPLNERWSQFSDLTTLEQWTIAPSLALMLAIGVYPQMIVGVINHTAMKIVQGISF